MASFTLSQKIMIIIFQSRSMSHLQVEIQEEEK